MGYCRLFEQLKESAAGVIFLLEPQPKLAPPNQKSTGIVVEADCLKKSFILIFIEAWGIFKNLNVFFDCHRE